MTKHETCLAEWIVTTQWVVTLTDVDTHLTKIYTRLCNNCIRQNGFQRKLRVNSNPKWRRLHRIRKLDEESNQLAREQAIYKSTQSKRNTDSEQVRESPR